MVNIPLFKEGFKNPRWCSIDFFHQESEQYNQIPPKVLPTKFVAAVATRVSAIVRDVSMPGGSVAQRKPRSFLAGFHAF